jgi:hypothetical protein
MGMPGEKKIIAGNCRQLSTDIHKKLGEEARL